jgi:hypothetical protein
MAFSLLYTPGEKSSQETLFLGLSWGLGQGKVAWGWSILHESFIIP